MTTAQEIDKLALAMLRDDVGNPKARARLDRGDFRPEWRPNDIINFARETGMKLDVNANLRAIFTEYMSLAMSRFESLQRSKKRRKPASGELSVTVKEGAIFAAVANPKNGDLVLCSSDGREVFIFNPGDPRNDSIGQGYFDSRCDEACSISKSPRVHVPYGVATKRGGYGTCLYTALCVASYMKNVNMLRKGDGPAIRRKLRDGVSSIEGTRSGYADEWWRNAREKFSLVEQVCKKGTPVCADYYPYDAARDFVVCLVRQDRTEGMSVSQIEEIQRSVAVALNWGMIGARSGRDQSVIDTAEIIFRAMRDAGISESDVTGCRLRFREGVDADPATLAMLGIRTNPGGVPPMRVKRYIRGNPHEQTSPQLQRAMERAHALRAKLGWGAFASDR